MQVNDDTELVQTKSFDTKSRSGFNQDLLFHYQQIIFSLAQAALCRRA
ncbi:hypothetical protein Sesv_2761 [Salmonella enterica subsp. enterica serovar Virchow str. SVQ1]|nr:hypothetical protein Sesv_2761 [Salmonella enterica subsp. enterica serovar Virchow str. SVQ1]